MRYSTHIDYLVASVLYLGTQDWWWARTPREMARELSLDEEKLRQVFDGFPGLFRKSARVDDATKQHMYSLQARYAKKDHKDAADKANCYIPPVETEKLRLLLDFILQSAEQETTRRHTLMGNMVAVGAAIVSSIAAITAALLAS